MSAADRVWVSVDTTELETLTAGFDAARADLASARSLVVGADSPLLAGAAVSGAFALAQALDVAAGACEAARVAVAERADALRSALSEYDGAESVSFLDRVLAQAGQVGWHVPLMPNPAQVGEVVWATRSGNEQRAAFPGELAGEYAVTSGLSAIGSLSSRLLPRPSDPVADAAERIALLPAQPSSSPPAAAGIEDLSDRIAGAYAASGETDSAVEVQRVDHADGTRSWVVAVPGTMGTLATATIQPMGVSSDPPAYLGASSAVDALVVSAMVAAGVRKGEPVLLAGHSLGGIAVTNLARDPAVRARFDVAGVVTLGSPVSHLPAPDVPTLNVQHAQDGFPALSGGIGARPGGPAPDEVVVVRELPDAVVGGVGAHAIGEYGVTLTGLELMNHPGLIGFDQAMSGLWAEPGDAVTATTYRGTTRS